MCSRCPRSGGDSSEVGYFVGLRLLLRCAESGIILRRVRSNAAAVSDPQRCLWGVGVEDLMVESRLRWCPGPTRETTLAITVFEPVLRLVGNRLPNENPRVVPTLTVLPARPQPRVSNLEFNNIWLQAVKASDTQLKAVRVPGVNPKFYVLRLQVR